MNKLRELRLKSNLKVIDVAKIMNVHVSTVYFWENGKSYPSTSKLPKIAKLYGCTIDDLYGESVA